MRDHWFLTWDGKPEPDRLHEHDERIVEGAWVIVRPRSLIDAGHSTERLYIVRQADVLGVLTVVPDSAPPPEP